MRDYTVERRYTNDEVDDLLHEQREEYEARIGRLLEQIEELEADADE